MNHIDNERIAAYVLDPADQLDATEQAHLDQCDHCANELAELQQLLTAAGPDRAGDPLQAPGDRVWAAIAADIAANEGQRGSEPPAAEDGRAFSSGRHSPTAGPAPADIAPIRPKTRSRWVLGVVAALVGVLVGVLGTVAIRAAQSPSESVVAEIALQPLPGKSGTGQATLIKTSSGLELRVVLSGIEVSDADLEVWLINTDGKQMRSLGLSSSTGKTFFVPGWLIPDDYRIVDISVEPHDGNLDHSQDSEVRGTLPA